MESETEICFSNAVRARSVAVGSTPLSVADVFLCYLGTENSRSGLRAVGDTTQEHWLCGAGAVRADPEGCANGSHHPTPRSQNCQGWKGPLVITQPKPLPGQGHTEQGTQVNASRWLWEVSKREAPHLLWAALPLLCRPQCNLTLRWNFLCCNLWMLLLILLQSTTRKTLSLAS